VAPDAKFMAVSIRIARNGRGLEVAAPVALFQTHLAVGGNIPSVGYQARAQYAVAADGRFLMNVLADDAVTSPMTIMLNWPAALRK
jgi:hypothetical protein